MFVKQIDEMLIDGQCRFSAGKDDLTGRIGENFLHNLFIGEHFALLVLRVAETAVQIASGEAHEHRRRAAVEPFTLQTIENLVNLFHRKRCCLLTP